MVATNSINEKKNGKLTFKKFKKKAKQKILINPSDDEYDSK